MEDFRTVSKLIQRNYFLTSIDLKDAYFLIPIDKYCRRFLRFKFNNTLYEFTCMPFGLSTAPYIFTKLLKPVMTYLRDKDITCVNYLDDFLIIGQTFMQCQENTKIAVNLLESLGFVINYFKSSLTPSQRHTYLGFVFDTHLMRIELPLDKRAKIKKWVNYLKNKTTCKIRYFTQFIGFLVSCCPAVKYGWLYTKTFEREKFIALKNNNMNYNAVMSIPDSILSDLSWWYNNIDLSYNDIKRDLFDMEIYTDASLTGWGAYMSGRRAHGWWCQDDKTKHINILELKAIFLSLQKFCENVRDANILIRSDNTTAISYVNRMGSIQYKNLSFLAREIWQWCEARNLWLFASYIKSEHNWQADEESRILPPETEWSLAPYAFSIITSRFGIPEVDLFASKDNNKCEKYISWHADPNAWNIDAFTVPWNNIYFYAFPPFSLILRVLQKIKNDKSTGIVVVPDWKSQVWYPLFNNLIIGTPIIFKPNKRLLRSSFSSEIHPLAKTLSLVAAKLSGRASN